MPELSPAAEAVLDAAKDAYGINYSEFHCCADRVAAAALRVLANQYDFAETGVGVTEKVVLVDDILKIATELEAI